MSNANYKPQGYTSVAPYIMADGAQRVIDFLRQTFGAQELRRFDDADGSVLHAEVRIDDTVVMIADGGERAFPTWIHVYVPDVDATYRRALGAGGVVVQDPVQKDDPDRRGACRIRPAVVPVDRHAAGTAPAPDSRGGGRVAPRAAPAGSGPCRR